LQIKRAKLKADTSTPYRPSSNCDAESNVRFGVETFTRIIHGASLNQGVWPLAVKYIRFSEDDFTPCAEKGSEEEPITPYRKMFGHECDADRLPFGCAVEFQWPERAPHRVDNPSLKTNAFSDSCTDITPSPEEGSLGMFQLDVPRIFLKNSEYRIRGARGRGGGGKGYLSG
jgi:hypothetical protein